MAFDLVRAACVILSAIVNTKIARYNKTMANAPFAYLAQLNSTVCDLEGNAAHILEAARKAANARAQLCLTPELSLTGWPLHGWLANKDFQKAVQASCRELTKALAKSARGVAVVFGAPAFADDCIYNALYLVKDGKCLAQVAKHELSRAGSIDERAFFAKGGKPAVVDVAGVRLGLAFASDVMRGKNIRELQEKGVQAVAACGAFVFERERTDERRKKLAHKFARKGLPLMLVNAAGGQDELVFEGASFTQSAFATTTAALDWFDADEAWVDKSMLFHRLESVLEHPVSGYERLMRAVVCALRDYVVKNGFTDVVLGLSGGADSALTAALAVEALGKKHVHAVMMPARFTSDQSLRLAKQCAENLGIDYRIRPVGAIYDAALEVLQEDFKKTGADLTEENLQARSRGVTLMALSNKFGWLTLATGNKSESATGYCTLYGDTTGAFAPIKDLYKTDVWEMMRTYNALKVGGVIPEEIITRPPSAELSQGQTDEAALMPYAELDRILQGLLARGESVDELVAKGASREAVLRVVRLYAASEFKRRQCPVGPKLTASTLGCDLLLPLSGRPKLA